MESGKDGWRGFVSMSVKDGWREQKIEMSMPTKDENYLLKVQ